MSVSTPMHQRAPHAEPRERRGQRAAAVVGEVELVHGARQVQVGVGVERVGETLRLVLEVGLHLELRPEIAGDARGLGHAPAAEALVPLVRRTVGDRAELAGQPQAETRTAPGLVVAAAPRRVAAHHLPLQRAQRDGERLGARRAGDRDEAVHLAREQRAVGEHGHAAERGPDDRGDALDAERAQRLAAGRGDVLDGDLRESRCRTAGRCADRSTPGSTSRTGCRAN